jgi:hypothetical protein
MDRWCYNYVNNDDNDWDDRSINVDNDWDDWTESSLFCLWDKFFIKLIITIYVTTSMAKVDVLRNSYTLICSGCCPSCKLYMRLTWHFIGLFQREPTWITMVADRFFMLLIKGLFSNCFHHHQTVSYPSKYWSDTQTKFWTFFPVNGTK